MTRSRRLLGATAAGALAAFLLAPAAAITSLADVPVAEDPVTLGADAENAPEVEPGLYTLRMPQSVDPAYFSVPRTMKKSTIWVGETMVTERPIDARMFVTPSVDGDSRDCGTGTSIETYYNLHDFLSGTLRSSGAACQKSDRVTFSHSGWDSPKYGGAEAQLAVWEEPAVDASILPPPALSLPWVTDEPSAKGEVDLGSSYAEAPELVDGRWEVHVEPGRTALFKVPLDWNQHLQLGLSYDGAETLKNVTVRPVLINPVGGPSEWGKIAEVDGVDSPVFPDVDLKYPSIKGGVVSPSITWRNREADGVTAAFPGTYFVLLRLGKKDVEKQGADITISTQVITDKAPSSPYDEEAAPVPALDGSTPVNETETKDDASSTSSDDATPWVAVSGLFGGSAVMTVIGMLALGRHRRSRA